MWSGDNFIDWNCDEPFMDDGYNFLMFQDDFFDDFDVMRFFDYFFFDYSDFDGCFDGDDGFRAWYFYCFSDDDWFFDDDFLDD